MNRKNETVRSVVLGTVRRQPLLCTALVLAVAGAVAASLLPPLVLGRVVDRLTARQVVPFALALGYFGLLALSGGLDSLRESLLTVFGQRMTHALRSAMCAKLDKLPAEAFVNQESGAAVSRFVGDVDTVEELFTSGIISMFADACRLCGILAVIFAENRGLALILLVVLPLLYLFTRVVQKRMLKASCKTVPLWRGLPPMCRKRCAASAPSTPCGGKITWKKPMTKRWTTALPRWRKPIFTMPAIRL